MSTITHQLFSLPIYEQLTPYLSLCKKDELPLIIINHPKVRAAISLQGAQLLAWQPSGQEELLWLSNNSEFKVGKAIRGGIPICWPWFGKAYQPSHGFARNSLWEFTAHDESETGVWLTFTLRDNEETRLIWPYEFCLIARFKLADTCHIELEAHGEFTTTSALHSYFNISDIAQISVNGLGSSYQDKILNHQSDAGETSLHITQEIDRIYTQAESCNTINDSGFKRHIELYHHHNSDVVVWNPWLSSLSMSDMCNTGYKTMICVETACINKTLVSTEQNPALLGLTIRCRELD